MKIITLDSDVVLDALLHRSPFDLSAMNILNMAYQHKLKLFISAVAFVNVNYFLNKYDRENRKELLKGLRKIVNIAKVDELMVDEALNSNIKDFEDAVQYYAAKAVGAQAIITRNFKDYRHADIPVFTPDELLKTL